MKTLRTHQILGTTPREPRRVDERESQWESLVRMWARSRNLDPDRLREDPNAPPVEPSRYVPKPPKPKSSKPKPEEKPVLWEEAIAGQLWERARTTRRPTNDYASRLRVYLRGRTYPFLIHDLDEANAILAALGLDPLPSELEAVEAQSSSQPLRR